MAVTLVEHVFDDPVPIPGPRSHQRKRKWHSKVRTGCSLCRKRRVKCDEARPGCVRCRKTGRECPGYEPPKTWLFEPERQPAGQQNRTKGLQMYHTLSASPFAHNEGSRSFQYYFEVSEPSVSRFFGAQMASLFDNRQGIEDAINTTEIFWKAEFPRLVCAIPAMQSCLLVMTTAHEHVQKAGYAFRQDPSCISKYGVAVAQLREEYNNLSIDSILLGSLLLAMGELAYGPGTTGLMHLYSASRIIEQRKQDPSTFDSHEQKEESAGLQKIVDLLFGAFFRKISRENYLTSSKIQDTLNGRDMPKFTIDLPFSTLQQVIGSLEEVKHAAIHIIRTGSRQHGAKAADLQAFANSWLKAFDEFVGRPRKVKAWGYDIACLVIRIHGCMALILSTLPCEELDFDEQKPLFSRMADTAEELFERTRGRFSDSVREQLVHGMGLVNPLFFAATKCRDYSQRRRLLGVLKQLRIAEGGWTSCIAYQIAVRLSKIEDKETIDLSAAHTIPSLELTRLVSAHLDDDSTVTMVYVICGFGGSEYGATHTDTFNIRPCEHQKKLPSHMGFISEYGGVEGYVAESTCQCVEPAAALEKDLMKQQRKASYSAAKRPWIEEC